MVLQRAGARVSRHLRLRPSFINAQQQYMEYAAAGLDAHCRQILQMMHVPKFLKPLQR